MFQAFSILVEPNVNDNGLGAFAATITSSDQVHHAHGATILEAGMRAFVASRLGDEFSV